LNPQAVRATLILVPLLGLHYLLTPFRPSSGSAMEKSYLILSAIASSFQVTIRNIVFIEVFDEKSAASTCTRFLAMTVRKLFIKAFDHNYILLYILYFNLLVNQGIYIFY
jgi:hypothetical protein